MNLIKRWNKTPTGEWHSLMNLDLGRITGEGVYVIWKGVNYTEILRVGQGKISDRLAEHRTNPDIAGFSVLGLWVTWTEVESQYRDGVERFLGNNLGYGVGERFPEEEPVEVNPPW
jgi:hypothetical protein